MSAIAIHDDDHSRGSERQSPAAGHPRLLIVDDDPRALRIFRRILSQVDRHCLTFEHAGHLIEALHGNPDVDVILSDLRMPQTDGIELIRQVREQFSDRRWLQFILVTGQATMDTAISALRLDAVDYLFKPVMPRELLSTVRNAMSKTRRARSMLARREEVPTAECLDELARVAQSLAVDLSKLALSTRERIGDHPENGECAAAASSCARMRSHAQYYESLSLLTQLQDERSRLFGAALPPDPAWEMLAELMLGQYTGRRVSVTSLCLASKAPVTTALRRIEDMLEAKLITRFRDPNDRRRSYVQLSDLGVQTMQQYLACVDEKLGFKFEPASMTLLEEHPDATPR